MTGPTRLSRHSLSIGSINRIRFDRLTHFHTISFKLSVFGSQLDCSVRSTAVVGPPIEVSLSSSMHTLHIHTRGVGLGEGAVSSFSWLCHSWIHLISRVSFCTVPSRSVSPRAQKRLSACVTRRSEFLGLELDVLRSTVRAYLLVCFSPILFRRCYVSPLTPSISVAALLYPWHRCAPTDFADV